MYLAPHHFQAQRRHSEQTTAEALEALFPFAYGVTSAALDTEALAGGTLALAFARGIFPDGTVVSIPDADPVPDATPLAPRFAPDRESHVVYLAIPEWRDDAPNVRFTDHGASDEFGREMANAAESNGHDRRFVEVVAKVRDETSGMESTEIHFAEKQLRLSLDTELQPGDIGLPLARVRRDDLGRFVVDPRFVPPCLKVGASERLVDILRQVVGMVEAKGAALSASLGAPDAGSAASTPAAYIGNELATRWLLHAVRSAEPPLRHILATRNAHPERLWLELSHLAGALCTFSLTTQARELPVYTHDDLGTCFGQLEQHLRQHLDVVIAAQAVVVALAPISDVLYTASVSDPRCYATNARWFLGVRSSIGPMETRTRVPQLVKACATKFVLELVRRAYPGLSLEFVPSPPAGLAPRPDLAYFELTLAGPCAQVLRDSREFGVYVPAGLPDVSLEVAVLIPE